MELRKESLISRMYRWFYVTRSMPDTLCVYAPKLVIMFIFIIPSAILSFPINVIDRLEPEEEIHNNPTGGGIIWFLLFLVFCVFVSLGSIFIEYEPKSLLEEFTFMGWTVLFCCTVLGIMFSGIFLYKKIKSIMISNEYSEDCVEKSPNIISEYFKAKRNKYCPKITWK